MTTCRRCGLTDRPTELLHIPRGPHLRLCDRCRDRWHRIVINKLLALRTPHGVHGRTLAYELVNALMQPDPQPEEKKG